MAATTAQDVLALVPDRIHAEWCAVHCCLQVGTTFAEVEQVFGGDPRFVVSTPALLVQVACHLG
jgi:hypothetical protein